MLMVKAKIEDLGQIEKLYGDCTDYLNQNEIYQWDDKYPNSEMYKICIEDEELFLFIENKKIVGSVVLDEFQSDEWSSLNWGYNEGAQLVIHALAIDPVFQGNGYGQKALELCEEYAIKANYNLMRLDAFSENQVALKLYEKNGYRKVGTVVFDSKPVNHQNYHCYEKKLK
ncbi:MAG: GNAT family N-acetyltransferase [Clostridiales bacterium]|nr:GNAT family N-acetyltransferase [Clostridiales bacterium]